MAADRDNAAPLIMKSAMFVLVLFSTGIFNEKLGLPQGFEQYVAIAMWATLIFASYFQPRVLEIPLSKGLLVTIIFYGFAASSIGWGNYSMASALKGIALVLTTWGAFRVAVTVPLDDIIESLVAGFSVLMGLSILLSVFVPSIGVISSWMHFGQWSGAFASKQTLGFVGAYLMFFAAYLSTVRKPKSYYYFCVAMGAICVIESGSRGGGATALAAIACLYLCRRFTSVRKAMIFGPIIMTFAAYALISYFLITDSKWLILFGNKLDFTERTFIWQYALRHLHDNVFFGFGVNGFWTDNQIWYVFRREYGWVLDNYHNGYIAILMETGLIGMVLFSACYTLFCLRMLNVSRVPSARSSQYDLIICLTNLYFMTNFTETLFLRSTGIMSTVLTTLLLISFGNPASRQMRPQLFSEISPFPMHDGALGSAAR